MPADPSPEAAIEQIFLKTRSKRDPSQIIGASTIFVHGCIWRFNSHIGFCELQKCRRPQRFFDHPGEPSIALRVLLHQFCTTSVTLRRSAASRLASSESREPLNKRLWLITLALHFDAVRLELV